MPLTAREKKALIKRLDQDNDGRIDLIEYDMMVRQNRRKATQKQKQKQKRPRAHKHGHGHGHQYSNGNHGDPDSMSAIDINSGGNGGKDGGGTIDTDDAGTDDCAGLSASGKDIMEKEKKEGSISKEQLETWAGNVHRKSQEDANALFAGARDQVAAGAGEGI